MPLFSCGCCRCCFFSLDCNFYIFCRVIVISDGHSHSLTGTCSDRWKSCFSYRSFLIVSCYCLINSLCCWLTICFYRNGANSWLRMTWNSYSRFACRADICASSGCCLSCDRLTTACCSLFNSCLASFNCDWASCWCTPVAICSLGKLYCFRNRIAFWVVDHDFIRISW